MFDNINFQIIPNTMDALSLRQNVISQNIANYETPGYKRKYVDFENELQKALSEDSALTLKVNRDQHINNTLSLGKIQPNIQIDNSKSLRDDGNNVDPDMELVRMTQNTLKYNTLSRLTTYAIQRYETAIRGGK
ncbi:flagellar basal-body rod protein FlgB [Petrotoga mobilis SJ95]|uniref:Flagellar basal body rod protein FlgB n=1 Tax=Petrotoga mobilis (strain DSM 10674 / SJ95) TaxID=403833 RepID=A9BI87_PETMO|nr:MULTISPECIES: flagellar basal body rod protein FlgB [Petrotoga]MDK2812330.1 flagellar basal-body rod protein FlgB [Petrotoga sp.]ABX32378.1 flagellar basal-body rod protein FlgB [Petrotoga mobilis SJ95]MBL5981602.1 flagellar basal-body rod protein FlgB [Petrotoga sp. 8T1HF07.NaAc.6.1]PNR87696.1 flagellar basal-body rod protein FlgB [Petrotoga sp. 9T1HF07.CasAA.8.2]PNR92169.1 flagellar basal-body rod protein FlgB [Petrotoga sp. HWHPT.55.6.3]